jgi:hypothetical protein
MMAEMGSALKILTSEVLTSGVQQVLAATAMTALMSAIQWPIRESISITLDVNKSDISPHQTRIPD